MTGVYAIVDSNGLVVNTVIWDGSDNWAPPDAMQAINTNGAACETGWRYDGVNFYDPDYVAPSNQDMYQSELTRMAGVYNSDIMNLSDQYAKAALIDGVNENTKKAAIYAEYQARKVTYQADLAALKVKYGV